MRLTDRELKLLMADEKVIEAMRYRCDETEHHWIGACSILMQVYEVCKWCGETRR